jgi:hypothetical protein
MTAMRTLGAAVVGLALLTHPLYGQDGSRYRDYRLGANLSSISTLAGVDSTVAKTIHQRPALLQELLWQRPYAMSLSTAVQVDPVKEIVFSFYNDQLSRIVVDYDRNKTAGMTDSDLIDSISAQYGPRLKPGVRFNRGAASRTEEESGTLVARWGDAAYSVALYRSSYLAGFRLVVTSLPLEALSRTAAAESIRMDAREAPAKEDARMKKETEDARDADEKARIANKGAFKP